MAFIQIAYCISVPFFLLLSWFSKSRHFFMNLLAVSNLLLMGYAFFLVKQLAGWYRLARQLPIDHAKLDAYVSTTDKVRLSLIVLLPFLGFIKTVQKNRIYSIALLSLVYWNNPVSYWNTYDLFNKIAVYFCLLCSGYALLWLLNKLPYQPPVV
jgi:hypothetical protein